MEEEEEENQYMDMAAKEKDISRGAKHHWGDQRNEDWKLPTEFHALDYTSSWVTLVDSRQ